MSFFEVEFPRAIGYRAMGGPGFSTVVNQGFSGQEYRNRNWANSRGKWTIDLQTPSPNQVASRQSYIDLLLSFFLAVGGKADGFRLKDHKDFQATAQTISPITGSTTVYQLSRTYTIGGRSYVRNITKPITSSVTDYQGNALANTVQIYIGGVLQTSGYTLDYTTGLVTFGSAPGGAVTATCQYHFPVRFDTDDLAMQVEESNINAGQGIVSVHSVQLVEVLPPNY